MAHNIAGSS